MSAAESAEVAIVGGAIGQVYGQSIKAAEAIGDVATAAKLAKTSKMVTEIVTLTPYSTSAYNSKYRKIG